MKNFVHFLMFLIAFSALGQDPEGAFRFTNQMVHSSYVYSVAFSSDGTKVLSGSEDNTVKLWDMGTGKEIKTFTGHNSYVYSVAFSPDGTKALSGSFDNTVKLWDIATGKEIKTFTGHRSSVNSVAFSPDGTKALSGSYDHTFKLWDMGTGKEIKTFTGHSFPVNSVAPSPDGEKALSGSFDNTVKLWDVATGKEIKTFTGHSYYVNSVAFSPDGTKVLSGSGDNTFKLWDMVTGKEIKIITLNQTPIHVSFSNDGKDIRVGTAAYWVTFSVNKEGQKEIFLSPANRDALQTYTQQTTKIFWTNPNARKYTHDALKVNQDKLPIEAIISINLTENQLREALRVRVNGHLQTGKLGNVSLKNQQQDYDFEQSITLDEGQNTVEIIIAPPNQEVTKSIPLNVFYTPPLKANLYLFTFGVQFSDLFQTEKDAKTIHRLFKSQAGTLFNEVFAEGPFIGNETNASNIAKGLERLGNRNEIREQDVVLVFGSSHGDVIGDDFRILGQDWNPDSPRRSSISFNEDIITNLNKLNCKKIILLDACRSGVAVGKRLADANKVIADTPVGTITITSSTGIERSYENVAWDNSSFVKAIKEALEEGKANTNYDRYVTLQELFDYLKKRVPTIVKSVKELENFNQTPQMKIEHTQDFPIYLLK